MPTELVRFPMWGAASALSLTLAAWPAQKAKSRRKPKVPRKGACPICKADNVALTRDHWTPLSRGGRGLRDNIVWMCGPCNNFKADRLPEEIGWTRPT